MTMHSLTTLSNTSATRLTPNGTHSGIDITLQNVNASGYIYIGGDSEISDTNYGFRIMPNHSISFELPGRDELYAIASVNEMKVAVIKTNLESGS
jgi:hypothetical protein